MGRAVGYARISGPAQDLQRQVAALRSAGCERIYQEQASGAAGKDQPELDRCLADLVAGDALVLAELSRLGRTTGKVVTRLDSLLDAGVTVRALDYGLTLTPARDNPLGELVATILAALAKIERDTLVRRLADGREYAKRVLGRYSGRKPVDPAKVAIAVDLIRAGRPLRQAAMAAGIGRTTLYDALDRLGLDPAQLREQRGNL
ncbi:recombinase family protein [Caenispirillum bisanense]|uniref:recombinase family protein n=1 Tax=Caenispirillum bisanense TaxID=414052 RepID=UPI0031DA32E4